MYRSTCVEIEGQGCLPFRQDKGITVVKVGHRLAPLREFDFEQAWTELHMVQGVRLAQWLLVTHLVQIETLHKNVPHHLWSKNLTSLYIIIMIIYHFLTNSFYWRCTFSSIVFLPFFHSFFFLSWIFPFLMGRGFQILILTQWNTITISCKQTIWDHIYKRSIFVAF